MNTSRLTTARRLFVNDMTPRHIIRHNMRAWIRSLRLLGDRWLLAQSLEKTQ